MVYKVNLITKEICKAASNLGVKCEHITEYVSMLTYGSKTVSFMQAMPDTNGAVTSYICRNKYVTNKFLEYYKFPVLPMIQHNTAQESEVFMNLHKPLVVKPIDGMQGNGVTTDVNNIGDLLEAVEAAREYDTKQRVVIEKQANGYDHRVTVIGKTHIFVLKKIKPTVTGDGYHTVQELIDLENIDRKNKTPYLKDIKISKSINHILKTQNINLNTVPQNGQNVLVGNLANISKGATVVDVTDIISNKIKEVSLGIANRMNADVIGLDIITQDITNSNSPFYVIEVNHNIGILGHKYPTKGKSRDVAECIIKIVFNLV
jgi:cyanophycin synthetase